MRQTLTLLLALVLLAGCAGAATPVPPAASPSAGPTAQPTQPPAANSPLPSATPSAVTEATTPPTDAPPATATPAEAAGAAVVWVQGGDLMLKRLPGGEEVALTGEGDVVDFPEFSPDGRLILYRRQGPPATISADPAAEVPSSTFWAIPVAGGTPRLVLDPLAALPAVPGTGSLADDLYPSEPGPLAWLPGGRQALFSSRYLTANSALGSYDLWRLDVETGQLEALLPAG